MKKNIEILGSYLRQLEELKDKDFMAHPDAMELNRQIDNTSRCCYNTTQKWGDYLSKERRNHNATEKD